MNINGKGNRRSFLGLALGGGVAVFGLSCATRAGSAFGGPLAAEAGGYELQVLVDGALAPTFQHDGETYVMGQHGSRYTLRIVNRTGRRIEAVASVDGLDVIDGKPADARKRGYLVPAWGSVDIDGWRLSMAQAAAFRFSTVADSYAARTGSARNVGVIGVAVFPERIVRPRPQPVIPYDDYRRYRSEEYVPRGGDLGASRGDADGYGGAQAQKRASGREVAPAAPSAPAGAGARDRAEAEAPSVLADEGVGRAAKSAAPQHRPGLGTEFGEQVDSRIREVSFVRAHATRPSVTLGVRYNDRRGLIAMGVDVDGWRYAGSDNYLRRTAEPFPASHRRFAAPPRGWR